MPLPGRISSNALPNSQTLPNPPPTTRHIKRLRLPPLPVINRLLPPTHLCTTTTTTSKPFNRTNNLTARLPRPGANLHPIPHPPTPPRIPNPLRSLLQHTRRPAPSTGNNLPPSPRLPAPPERNHLPQSNSIPQHGSALAAVTLPHRAAQRARGRGDIQCREGRRGQDARV